MVEKVSFDNLVRNWYTNMVGLGIGWNPLGRYPWNHATQYSCISIKFGGTAPFFQYGRPFLLFFNQSFETIKGQGVGFVQSGFIISLTMKGVTINAKKKSSTNIKIKNVVRLCHNLKKSYKNTFTIKIDCLHILKQQKQENNRDVSYSKQIFWNLFFYF